MATVGSFGGRSQTKPQRRDGHQRRLPPKVPRQMMALVKNNELELIAKFSHVNRGAVIGRDRDRPVVEGVVTNNSRVKVKRCQDSPMPLVHQIPHRSDDQSTRTG